MASIAAGSERSYSCADWHNEPLEKYLEHKRTVDDVTDTRFNDIQNIVVESPEQ